MRGPAWACLIAGLVLVALGTVAAVRGALAERDPSNGCPPPADLCLPPGVLFMWFGQLAAEWILPAGFALLIAGAVLWRARPGEPVATTRRVAVGLLVVGAVFFVGRIEADRAWGEWAIFTEILSGGALVLLATGSLLAIASALLRLARRRA